MVLGRRLGWPSLQLLPDHDDDGDDDDDDGDDDDGDLRVFGDTLRQTFDIM